MVLSIKLLPSAQSRANVREDARLRVSVWEFVVAVAGDDTLCQDRIPTLRQDGQSVLDLRQHEA